jgi:cyclophilin family peptidyl-prolyl cis-trans isomerase
MVMIKRQQAMSMQRQSSNPGILGGGQQQQQYQQQEQIIGSPTKRNSSSKAARRNSSFTSCAMGDEDNCSVSTISSHQSYSSNLVNSRKEKISSLPSFGGGCGNTGSSSSRNLHHHQTVKTPRWVLAVLCVFTALSWIRAIQYRTASFDIISAMDIELESLVFQKKQTVRLYKNAQNARSTISKQQWKLKKTQRLFTHETRMIEEIAEIEASSENGDNVELPAKYQNRKSATVTKKWIEHRQDALLHKVYNLQAYIQEGSRKRVIEKYGPGPHHVRFDVKSREGRKPGTFMVRMAPLSTVPHAVEAFLDMVTDKVWDNTVFYSHHTQDHVIAAAPIVYGTFQSKDHQMESLGYEGVSFPEYSDSFPHKQYTLGFAGNGPNFYINPIDNAEHHGPGGIQRHHDLSTDADPCFGEIVSGFDVVRSDMQMGRHKGKKPKGWADYDLTRVVTVKLVSHQFATE